ncbi:hypothetical protein EJ04DRAFT_75110 [Polyplosphaeria fusca]|uniref:Uncharacterized protein n=1 Tax=Polyplosphaeria fusca TaxID=682080 RepID=A0A9P4UUX2_9PLEO|nr:hypothetical protein EJ04DRAFT_75110 [Polyplosphaeria fusca]
MYPAHRCTPLATAVVASMHLYPLHVPNCRRQNLLDAMKAHTNFLELNPDQRSNVLEGKYTSISLRQCHTQMHHIAAEFRLLARPRHDIPVEQNNR